MMSIQPQTLGLPAQAPVMFLPMTLMPQAMVPLYIFEPRYRAMLAHCLEEDRMFCVALLQPGVTEVTAAGGYFRVTGLGLLRACVGHPDGTSHLVLQGLARVQLRRFVQEEPFRIADLRELSSEPAAGPAAEALMTKIRRACAELLPGESDDRKKLREQIAEITDAGILCDVVAHTFLQSPYHQQEVLEEVEVLARLGGVLRLLKKEATED